MATTTSLEKHKPKLESVFGPITESQDAELRALFQQCDDALIGIAKCFGKSRAGWEGTGLELTLMPYGQASISSFVDTCQDDQCVDFCVELRPGWYCGEMTGVQVWEVEASISADHQRQLNYGMDTVYELPIATSRTPIESAHQLLSLIKELAVLANAHPTKYWLSLTMKDDESQNRG